MMIYPDRELKKSIKEQVEERLFEDIVCGVYPPGTVLNEGTLTKKFGVSKSPVREALVTLCRDGVLMNIPRCGYQVVPLSGCSSGPLCRAGKRSRYRGRRPAGSG